MEESISLLWNSFSTWGTWANFKTPHDQALMLVAACRDFLTLSWRGWWGVVMPLLLHFRLGPALEPQPCQLEVMLQMVFTCVIQAFLTATSHMLQRQWWDLNSRSLVTAVALNGSGSTLQPLFSLYTVIYEQSWISSTLSVLAAALISVVMSWFPDSWSFAELTCEQSQSRYTWWCCGFLFSVLLSWKPLLFSHLCLCSWKAQQDLLQHSTSPDPDLCRRHFFLDCEFPHAASESLLKPFILFGTES